MAEVSWEEIKHIAFNSLQHKGKQDYIDRLNFEIKEIEKQGAESKFCIYYNDHKRFQSAGNKLLILWLLDLVDQDPIINRSELILNTVRASKIIEFKKEHGYIPSDLIKDPDMPDIDVDCLPEARDPIKEYAISKYGSVTNDNYGSVCSVGTWTTYKFKSAIIDVCSATEIIDKQVAYDVTTKLPDEVDDLKDGGYSICKGIITNSNGVQAECKTQHNTTKCPNCGSTETEGPTIGKLIDEHEELKIFANKYPKIIELAVKLVGRIRNMGMHAGALIITDRPLFGNIPLAKSSKKDYWISMWTEGRNTQLSKFGYQKWDLLGLKTLKYIYNCCILIEQNRGISFGENMNGWDDIDPTQDRAGHFFDSKGHKHYIRLNDEHVIKWANEQKTDGVFQFDTELSKCCAFDSKISLADGSCKPIINLDPQTDSIIYLSETGIKGTNNYEVKHSGCKKIKRIIMDNGKIMSLTDEHMVLTNNGYKMVIDLKVGDEIIESHDHS